MNRLCALPPPCGIYRVRCGIHFLFCEAHIRSVSTVYVLSPHRVASTVFGTVYTFSFVRLTFVLFQMSQPRAAKRVCKNPGTKVYYSTKSCNDVARREWLYRDGAARKVLGDRDFVFGDEITRDNLLKIAVTSDELREVNVYKVCVQPLDGSEFTVHVDVAACRISDLKSQIRARNGMCPSEQLLYLISSSSGSVSPKPLFDGKDSIVSDCKVSL